MNQTMSYFKAPIAPQKDAEGNVTRKATVVPLTSVTLEQVHQLITADPILERLTNEVRNAPDYSAAKTALLPFVTPCGTFTYRNSGKLIELSGLLPIDIDRLSTLREADSLRDRLFDDDLLTPALCYVSPSGRGVKAFIPYSPAEWDNIPPREALLEATLFAMEYVRYAYGSCDTSGKDVARCSFLCHDKGARMRLN